VLPSANACCRSSPIFSRRAVLRPSLLTSPSRLPFGYSVRCAQVALEQARVLLQRFAQSGVPMPAEVAATLTEPLPPPPVPPECPAATAMPSPSAPSEAALSNGSKCGSSTGSDGGAEQRAEGAAGTPGQPPPAAAPLPAPSPPAASATPASPLSPDDIAHLATQARAEQKRRALEGLPL